MVRAWVLLIVAGAAGCAAAPQSLSIGTQSQTYRVSFASSVRQTEDGALEVLARDSALLTLTIRGTAIEGVWLMLDGTATSQYLSGVRTGDAMLLRAAPVTQTLVTRECSDDGMGEQCTAAESKVLLVPEYALTFAESRMRGAITMRDPSGRAVGPAMDMSGYRTRS